MSRQRHCDLDVQAVVPGLVIFESLLLDTFHADHRPLQAVFFPFSQPSLSTEPPSLDTV